MYQKLSQSEYPFSEDIKGTAWKLTQANSNSQIYWPKKWANVDVSQREKGALEISKS